MRTFSKQELFIAEYIKEMCFANPRAIVPHPTNCAQYFDCSRDNTQFGHYLMECDYPMLFDEQSLQCRNFFDVTCGKKFEPKAPCKFSPPHFFVML